MWPPQIEALFDIWVTDVDAPSYVSRSVADVLATAEEEKKHKYVHTGLLLRSIVSPFYHLL